MQKKYDDKTKGEFLTIVQNYYNGTSKVGEVSDAKALMDFAIMHQLHPLLFAVILKDETSEVYDKSDIRAQYFSAIKKSALFAREANRFAEYLKAHDARFAYIKGQYIKDFYRPSEVRTMGDMDIYIPKQYLEIARAYMQDNGYEQTEYYEQVTTFSKGIVSIEVHDEIEWFGENWADDTKLTVDGFDIVTELKYTIIHALKHIAGFGCGVRQVLDIALLLREDSTILDDATFKVDIERIKVDKCFRALIGLINKWFGTMYNVETDASAVSVLETAILDGGVFGKNLNDYATINTVQHKSKAKMYFRMLFPKYERMVLSYPVLKDKKYLLFYYYMKRLFTRGLREKRYKIVYENGADNDLVKNRETFVKLLDLEDQHYNKM